MGFRDPNIHAYCDIGVWEATLKDRIVSAIEETELEPPVEPDSKEQWLIQVYPPEIEPDGREDRQGN